MINNKYSIWDTVWYIENDEVESFAICWIVCNWDVNNDFEWKYLSIQDIPYCCASDSYDNLDVEQEMFETEAEAKDALIKIFQEKINNLKQ